MTLEDNRHDWEFEYTASDVAKAAQIQETYRLGRVAVWEKTKAEVMEKIKSSGLTVHESLVEKMSSANNNYNNAFGQRGATVVVDNTLQRDLDEALAKIREHRDLAKQYNAWLQVLSANPAARLKLKHGDWMYFFGR